MEIEQHENFNPPTQDKRKKAYKDYVANFKEAHKNDSKGLGDTIDKITTKTGIKAALKFVNGNCDECEKRRQKANQKVPYKQVQYPSEDQFYWMETFLSRPDAGIRINYADRLMLAQVLKDVYGKVIDVKSKCASCWKGDENQIKILFETYQ